MSLYKSLVDKCGLQGKKYVDDAKFNSLSDLDSKEISVLKKPVLYAISVPRARRKGIMYVGITESPYERIYNHLTKGSFQSELKSDDKVDLNNDQDSVYNNAEVRVVTCQSRSEALSLESAAISKYQPVYNKSEGNGTDYNGLNKSQRDKVDSLTGDKMTNPLMSGTYFFVLRKDLVGTTLKTGDVLWVGQTKNLCSRITDHIQNRYKNGCLAHRIKTSESDDFGTSQLRESLLLGFKNDRSLESKWDEILDPEYSDFEHK